MTTEWEERVRRDGLGSCAPGGQDAHDLRDGHRTAASRERLPGCAGGRARRARDVPPGAVQVVAIGRGEAQPSCEKQPRVLATAGARAASATAVRRSSGSDRTGRAEGGSGRYAAGKKGARRAAAQNGRSKGACMPATSWRTVARGCVGCCGALRGAGAGAGAGAAALECAGGAAAPWGQNGRGAAAARARTAPVGGKAGRGDAVSRRPCRAVRCGAGHRSAGRATAAAMACIRAAGAARRVSQRARAKRGQSC